MEEWFTVRQAATELEVTPSRVYQLLTAGVLAGKLFGLVRFVSRRSVALYKDSENRTKFAPGHLRPISAEETGSLFESVEDSPLGEDSEWSGLSPVTLSDDAKRLHGATLLGLREARVEAERLKRVG